MSKHGTSPDSSLNVYQVFSSVINPLKLHEIFGYSCEHYMLSPLKDSRGEAIGIGSMKFFSSLVEFSAYTQAEVAEKFGIQQSEAASNPKRYKKLEVIWKKTLESLIYKAKIYEPYAFYKGWFYNGNTQNLMAEMSEDELRTFPVDLRSIDWKNYFINIHIPGLKGHVLKGGKSTDE